MLVAKSWDEMTDEEMLVEMDDFGDSHSTIHEAAKRIRAKNDRIATLEAALTTVTAERNEAFNVGQALEAERDAVRAEAFAEAAQIALRHTGAFPAQRIADALFIRAAQPEPEAEAVDDIDRLEEAQNAGNAGFLAD